MDFTIKKKGPSSNKGSYGRVYIVDGSSGMCGSIYLASMAALRCGSRLVYTVVPEVISEIMQVGSVENIILPLECEDKKLNDNSISQVLEYISNKNCVATGYGMGKDKLNYELVKSIFKNFHKPVLIGADELNSIGNLSELELEGYSAAITLHPLEFSRLLELDVEYINRSHERVATDLSKKHRCIVALKGHHTVVAKGDEIYVNNTGDAGMATAGSRDCLSGIIASFMHNRDVFGACKLGMYIHRLIGDFAEQKIGEDSIITSDITRDLPGTINACKEK